MEQWIAKDLRRENYSTGDNQFNGEWLFGTYLMAGLGYGQMILDHPEWRARYLPLMEICVEKILTSEIRAFDHESWNEDPIESLNGDSDHAAYLGYFNLLLSLHRQIEPYSKYAVLNEEITQALVRRIKKSPTLLLYTYPNEMYPVDNCAVAASIGLYDRVTGSDHRALLSEWSRKLRDRYTDPKSGLLFQAVNGNDGTPIDAPRGSGTCLGAYFLSFSDPALARELYLSAKKQLFVKCLGFGVMREYAFSSAQGRGDIDSGPLIFGIGVSPTGFSISSAKMFHDEETFSALFSTADMFGAPLNRGDKLTFVMGGPLGNAIMFAMLTARSPTPDFHEKI